MIYITGRNAILGGSTAQNQWENCFSESEVFSFNKSVEYGQFIPTQLIRRMSGILRMSTTSAFQCMKKAGIEEPEAIILGTGLGCLTETEKFLSSIWEEEEEEGILSPTSFIQSTHNTLAGQIALISKCYAYNSTYSDRGLSFENALKDGVLHIMEGKNNVLVGAADEITPELETALLELGCANTKNEVGEGAVFFALKSEKDGNSICLVDFQTFPIYSQSIDSIIQKFLNQNHITKKDVNGVVFGQAPGKNTLKSTLQAAFDEGVIAQNYQEFSGAYFTDSAFGLHFGCEVIKNSVPGLYPGESPKNVLVACQSAEQISLYLLSD